MGSGSTLLKFFSDAFGRCKGISDLGPRFIAVGRNEPSAGGCGGF